MKVFQWKLIDVLKATLLKLSELSGHRKKATQFCCYPNAEVELIERTVKSQFPSFPDRFCSSSVKTFSDQMLSDSCSLQCLHFFCFFRLTSDPEAQRGSPFPSALVCAVESFGPKSTSNSNKPLDSSRSPLFLAASVGIGLGVVRRAWSSWTLHVRIRIEPATRHTQLSPGIEMPEVAMIAEWPIRLTSEKAQLFSGFFLPKRQMFTLFFLMIKQFNSNFSRNRQITLSEPPQSCSKKGHSKVFCRIRTLSEI